jgi:hypothetical protein
MRRAAASTLGAGANALRDSLVTIPISNQARQYVLRSVAGQTAECFWANSHCTMTSARHRPIVGSRRRPARIAPDPANGRLETTENGSRGQLQ